MPGSVEPQFLSTDTICHKEPKIEFGDYKGLTVKEIVKRDRPYAQWLFLFRTELNEETIQSLSSNLEIPIYVRDNMIFMVTKMNARRTGPENLIKIRLETFRHLSATLQHMNWDRDGIPCFYKLPCGRSVYCFDVESLIEMLEKQKNVYVKFFIVDAILEKFYA